MDHCLPITRPMLLQAKMMFMASAYYFEEFPSYSLTREDFGS